MTLVFMFMCVVWFLAALCYGLQGKQDVSQVLLLASFFSWAIATIHHKLDKLIKK